MYEPIKEEADDIRFIFELYSHPNVSLGDVQRKLTEQGKQRNRRGSLVTTARLSETLSNPLYTQASREIYDFYKEQGTNIVNPIDEFNGETGLYLFRKSNSLVVAPHQGQHQRGDEPLALRGLQPLGTPSAINPFCRRIDAVRE